MASGPARSKPPTRAPRDAVGGESRNASDARDADQTPGKVSGVSQLTPYGWKAKWAPVVEAHRASIVERLMR